MGEGGTSSVCDLNDEEWWCHWLGWGGRGLSRVVSWEQIQFEMAACTPKWQSGLEAGAQSWP